MAAFKEWVERLQLPKTSYIDTHCWTFTPSSFELMVIDLNFLELIDFSISEISAANGNEFYVHLEKSGKSIKDEGEYFSRREEIMRNVSYEISQNSQKNGSISYFLEKNNIFGLDEINKKLNLILNAVLNK